MSKVKIVADSTCDLPAALREEYDIGIIPLHVILGSDIYEDGVNVTNDQIFAWAGENRDMPKTAAPSPREAAEIFSRFLKDYDEIVSLSLATGMSASNAAMHMAAEELGAEDRITVIDSENLSTGISLMVLEAAEMAAQGADAAAITEHVRKQIPLVRSSFVVDTLEYLHRGGRCSGLTALVGGTLHLHPKISVTDGVMEPGRKYRGKIDRAAMDYVRDLKGELMNAQPGRVFITYAGEVQDLVDQVYAYLDGLHHFEKIIAGPTGSVVACHCGPGTLGVLFLSQG